MGAVFFTVCLPFVVNPSAGFSRYDADWLALWGLAMWSLLWFAQHQPFQAWRFNTLSLLFLSWLGIVLLQAGLGMLVVYTSYTIMAASYLWAAVWLGVLVKQLKDSGHEELLIHCLLASVLIAGTLNALAVLLQNFQITGGLWPWVMPSLSHPRDSGFLGQPNICASLLVCAMLALSVRLVDVPWRMTAPSAWRVLLWCLLAWSLSVCASRAAMISLTLVTVLLWHQRRRLQVHWFWLGMPVWQGVISKAYEWSFEYFQGVAVNSVSRLGEGPGERMRIYKGTLHLIADQPWLGVGWRQFQMAALFEPGLHLGQPLDHPHNLLLMVQAELGILGSLALLGCGIWWLRKAKPFENALPASQVVMLAMVLVWFTHSLLEFPLWYAPPLFLLSMLMALLPSPEWTIHFSHQRHARRWGMGLGLLLCAVLIWIGIDHFQAQQLSDKPSWVWWFRSEHDFHQLQTEKVSAENLNAISRMASAQSNYYADSLPQAQWMQALVLTGRGDKAVELARAECTMSSLRWTVSYKRIQASDQNSVQEWLAQLPADLVQCLNPLGLKLRTD